MDKIRIIFADDHVIVRDGLRALLKSDPQFSLLGEGADGQEALELVAKYHPDVAMLDISMPRMNGIEATKVIKKEHPSTRIMILTIHENEQYVYEMLQAGADGYVLKNAEKKEIFDGIRAVAKGEHYFSSEVSKLLIGDLVKKARGNSVQEGESGSELTSRETEVLKFIAEGLTSRQIAEKLFLSVSTVNSHRANLKKKLNIRDTAGLVKYALQAGLTRVEAED